MPLTQDGSGLIPECWNHVCARNFGAGQRRKKGLRQHRPNVRSHIHTFFSMRLRKRLPQATASKARASACARCSICQNKSIFVWNTRSSGRPDLFAQCLMVFVKLLFLKIAFTIHPVMFAVFANREKDANLTQIHLSQSSVILTTTSHQNLAASGICTFVAQQIARIRADCP